MLPSYSYERYKIPKGFKMRSLATRAATSPPFWSEMAPIMAYSDVVRTTSIPDPFKLAGCDVSVTIPQLSVEKTYVLRLPTCNVL